MIAEQAADLAARIRTVSALATRAGLALGGQGTDPSLIKVPLPAAWIMYMHDQVDEVPYGQQSRNSPGNVPSVEVMIGTFSVVIYVPYVDENDLLTVQFPLLESVIKAVKLGGGAVNDARVAPAGMRWRYLGQKLSLVYPDRLAYEQHYTLNFPL